jgi:hypothetical protein
MEKIEGEKEEEIADRLLSFILLFFLSGRIYTAVTDWLESCICM